MAVSESDAWDALQLALGEYPAACDEDDDFILDEPDHGKLSEICRTCVVFDECLTYAELAKPRGGFWAGIQFDVNGRKRTGRKKRK